MDSAFITFSNYLLSQNFGGLYKGYKNYLGDILDSTLSEFYFKAKTQEKIVAITFDDGPLRNTQSIISLLEKEKIPATFFLVAQNITQNLVNLYDDNLFSVGVHTYKHDDYRKLDYLEKEHDINQCLNVFNSYNLKVKYFRPAYGIIDEDIKVILEKNNLKGVIWSIDSQDWNNYRGEKLVSNITENLKGGDIILFHDRLSLNDLVSVIDAIHKKGYEIVSIDRIMSVESIFPK
ncbi:MAG: polysaccharide deacetylase family protein [Campylobacterota bacterium]|nr:polysaccharide deacetylase family protein [Campylobacterota bacterium]